MPEEKKKPKPYSRKRQGTKAVKGDAQKSDGFSVAVEKKEAVEVPKEEVKTPKGKQYQVVKKALGCVIEFSTGGQIPKALSGSYTKEKFAWDAIKAYEAQRG